MRRTAPVLLLLVVGSMLSWPAAHAADIVVNSTAYSDDSVTACTLFGAIANASADNQGEPGCAAGNGADTIRFDPNVFATPQTIVVGNALILDGPVTIEGDNRVTIDGGGAVEVFLVNDLNGDGGMVALRNLVIANGSASIGGGIYMYGATLVLDHVTLRGNKASSGGGGYYGANGTATFNDCLFDGNSVTNGRGGGGANSFATTLNINRSSFVGNTASLDGGGLLNNGTVSVQNSTFKGNSGRNGSAIYHSGVQVAMAFTTVSGNTATSANGGAIYHMPSQLLSVSNSVVAGNSQGDCYLADGATITGAGHNFYGDSSCGTAAGGSAMLADLAYTGGLTPTMSPMPGSPLLDNGSCDVSVTTDQRGVARPQGAACDIGAVEVKEIIFADGFEMESP